jgi:hypothetical protein
MLDLVGIHVRGDRGGKSAGKHTFVYGKGNDNHELSTAFFSVHKGII